MCAGRQDRKKVSVCTKSTRTAVQSCSAHNRAREKDGIHRGILGTWCYMVLYAIARPEPEHRAGTGRRPQQVAAHRERQSSGGGRRRRDYWTGVYDRISRRTERTLRGRRLAISRRVGGTIGAQEHETRRGDGEQCVELCTTTESGSTKATTSFVHVGVRESGGESNMHSEDECKM
ncbi:hypothetical protein BKA93DRAFT_31572 [Sparassis latifolia]